MLHYFGEDIHEIHKASKSDQEPDECNRYETTKTDLAKIITPKKNTLVA